jgi:hypothetical protein
VRILSIAVGALIILGLLWVVVTGFIARSQATGLQQDLATLKRDLVSGRLSDAAVIERRIQSHAKRVRWLTGGPAWWVGSQLPYIGRPAKTAHSGGAIVDDLARQVLPQALQARELLRPNTLRVGPDQINLARIHQAAALLQPAATAAQSLLTRATALPSNGWLGFVNADRAALITHATPLLSLLHDFANLSGQLPAALGEGGSQRYLVVFQTDAEARGLGGLPGSWAILTADNGTLAFTRFGNDGDLHDVRVHPPLGRHYRHEFKHLFHHKYRPTHAFVNSDPSPHFPDAAKIWMAMWQKRYGRHVAGVITTDPGGLRLLLRAVGPVTLKDGMKIDTTNVVRFFEHGIYTKFANAEGMARKKYQERAAEAIAKKVLNEPSPNLAATTDAVRRAVGQRRLLVYVKNRPIERAIWNHHVSGVIPVTSQPFLGVVMNNIRAGKVGFYLRRFVTYRRPTCAATTATVTFRVQNFAPHNVLPYVGGRYTGGPLAGATQLVVSLYGTRGSVPLGVTVNGRSKPFRVKHERHHTVTIAPTVFVPGGGKTQKIVFTVHEPAATGPLMTLNQPGVQPAVQKIVAPPCG